MHDAKGRELKIGDRVLIPAIITQTHVGEDFCNISATGTIGRRPDNAKEYYGGINTGTVLRANEGDENADAFGIENAAPLSGE